jgi:hypothetical protein
MHTINLQHLNAKFLLKNSNSLDHGRDLDPVVPVFHSWIQEQSFDDLLLDVADYRHVQAGPGILLIGHEADYSVDNTDSRLGVRYNRKAVLDGNNQERLAQAALAALTATKRLQEDTRLDGKLYFNGYDIEIFVNDRLLAPNSASTREALNVEFQAFSERLFGGSEYSLSFGSDPRRLLAVSLKASRAFSVGELLENLRSSLLPAGSDLTKHRPSSAGPDAVPDYDWHEELNAAQGAD